MLRVALIGALLGAGALPALGQTNAGTIEGTIRASGSRLPVVAGELRIIGRESSARTDSAGHFTLAVPEGQWRIRAMAVGFRQIDLTVRVPARGTVRLDIELVARSVVLPPMDVRAIHDSAAGSAARALFEREVSPGVVTMSRREMQALPTIVEPDLLRSLQSLTGVTALNDFDAQLYVRGGAPDENLFLLDGARVFGPYHMFGMNGVFNTDAIDRTEFFRGAIPARYGGALSSVVDITQRDGDTTRSFDGGLSFLSARLTGSGTLPRDRGRWMVAARRTHADAALGSGIPYAFYDAQTRFSFAPHAGQRLLASVFTSTDRFGELGYGDRLDSRWRNAVGSVQWQWIGDAEWAASSVLWGSSYYAHFDVGSGFDAVRSANRLGVGGLRLEARRQTGANGLRMGIDIEGGRVALTGAETDGSYYSGVTRDDYLKPAIYAEGDNAFGRIRLAPGIRLVADSRRPGVLAEPRLGARLGLPDSVSITLGVGRSYQSLSTLRDERNIIPGAPFWFLHPRGTPVTRTDGVSVDMDRWFGPRWSLQVGGYARRFIDAPHWRPQGARDLSTVSYDDGEAIGVEATLRHFGERVNGWLGYSSSRTHFTDARSSARYDASWDRRHAVSGAVVARAHNRLHLSARTEYSSGHPFWPMAGEVVTPHFEPFFGRMESSSLSPFWSDSQLRLPAYFRVDVGMRTYFRFLGARIEPFLHLQNLTGRPNVISYRLASRGSFGEATQTTVLEPQSIAIPLPTFGFNVRF